MKNIKQIVLCGLALAGILSSCTKEADPVAKAVMAQNTYLEFEATGAAPQAMTIYSDGDWTVDAPDWITVSQTSGSGTVEGVQISVADNKDAQGLLLPRRDTVKFHGRKLISYSNVIVYQKGDKYRGAADATVATLKDVKDGLFVNVNGAKVYASDGNSVVLSDGETNILLPIKKDVTPGDVISFRGLKGTENGQPVVSDIENLNIDSHSDVSYPASAKDISGSLDALSVTAPEYVVVSGVFDGSSVVVEGCSRTVSPTALSSLGLAALTGHKVSIFGYTVSANASKVNMIATSFVDNGIDMVIYFKDDFEWLEPWTTATGAGDAVKDNDPGTTAPNVFTSATCEGFTDEMVKRGYGYIWGWAGQDWSDGTPDNGNKRTLYLQKNYLKFGKTSYNSGIILPPMSEISGTADIELNFDWCWHITAAAKADIMTLTVEVVGNGACDDTGGKTSGEIDSEQSTEDGQSKIEWQNRTVRINGVDANTRIIIRPTNADPAVSNPDRKQNRWYLDNILVVPAEGSGSGGGGGEDVPDNTSGAWTLSTDRMDIYGPTFGGATKGSDGAFLGENDKQAGDGGKYIDADEGNGKITYVQIDKTTLDSANKAVRNIGATGEPYMTGCWQGDYWLFTVTTTGSYPAGSKIHFKGTMRASGGGIKHWTAEVLDGKDWVPAMDVKSTTVEGAAVSYNIEMVNTDNNDIEFTYTTKSSAPSVQVRFVASSLQQANAKAVLAAPSGGTIRFKGGELSPVLEISK
ncbi:MAG: BACON domain-containing protein [Bacteroidales bacterium]|nr:BACON domain-containing protein [Bacteroidales bacterium]